MKVHTKNLVKLIRETVGDPKFGVEVGVHRGENSESLLEVFPNLFLTMVDVWRHDSDPKNTFHRTMGMTTQEDWDMVMAEAFNRTNRFTSRMRIFRTSSVKASKRHINTSLDFVFIDADHTYKSVMEDIKSWLPKVKKGGLISGHDYRNNGKRMEVVKAVHESFNSEKIMVRGGLIWGVVVE